MALCNALYQYELMLKQRLFVGVTDCVKTCVSYSVHYTADLYQL